MADDDKNSLTPDDDVELYATRQLSTAQTMITIALIGAPVSLIIGGLFLSAFAFVCAIVAYGKTSRVIERLGEASDAAARLRAQARIAIAIASFATVVNVVYLIYMLPHMIEFLDTGNTEALLNPFGQAQSAASSSASSVWG